MAARKKKPEPTPSVTMLRESSLESPTHDWGTDASADARLALFVGGTGGRAETASANDIIEKAVAAVVAVEKRQFPDPKARDIIIADARQQALEPAVDGVVAEFDAAGKRLAKALNDSGVHDGPIQVHEHPAARTSSDRPATTGDLYQALAQLRQQDAEVARLLALDPIEVPGEIHRAVHERRWDSVIAADIGAPRMPNRGTDIDKALSHARLEFRSAHYDDRSGITLDGLHEVVEHVRAHVEVAAARLSKLAPPAHRDGISRRVRAAFSQHFDTPGGPQTLDELVDSIQNRTAS